MKREKENDTVLTTSRNALMIYTVQIQTSHFTRTPRVAFFASPSVSWLQSLMGSIFFFHIFSAIERELCVRIN